MLGLLQAAWDHTQANHESIKTAALCSTGLALITGVAAFIADYCGTPIEATTLIAGFSTGTLAVALNSCRSENQHPALRLFCSSALSGASGALLMDATLHATHNAAEALNPFAAAAIGGAAIGAWAGYLALQSAIADFTPGDDPLLFSTVEPAWRRDLYQHTAAIAAGIGTVSLANIIHTTVFKVMEYTPNFDFDTNDIVRSYLFQLPLGITAAATGSALLGAVSAALPYAIEGVQRHQERVALERDTFIALTLLTGKMLGKNLGDFNILPDIALSNIASFLCPKEPNTETYKQFAELLSGRSLGNLAALPPKAINHISSFLRPENPKDPNSNTTRIVTRIEALRAEQTGIQIPPPTSDLFSNEQKNDIEMGLRTPDSTVSTIIGHLKPNSPAHYSAISGG